MPRANWKPEKRHEYNGRARARYAMPILGLCVCGERATDRHHINGNPTDNRPANIAQLCRRCHMRADGRLDLLGTYPKPKPYPPRPCFQCGGSVLGPLRRGMCRHCYDAKRRAPCATYHEARQKAGA